MPDDERDRGGKKPGEKGRDDGRERGREYAQRTNVRRGKEEIKDFPPKDTERLTYEKPDDKPGLSPAEREEGNERLEIELIKSNVPGLLAENWAKLPVEKRIAELKRAEHLLAGLQRRPKLRYIEIFEGKIVDNHEIVGHYDPIRNGIRIKADDLRSSDPRNAVRTFFEETRHAYQVNVIRDPAQHPEVAASKVEEWRQDFKEQMERGFPGTSEKILESRKGLLEPNANNYADRQIERLYDGRTS